MSFKVYYVDDEIELLEIFASTFETTDIVIKTFSNPLKALEAIACDPPDLLFLDYRLLGMNGDFVAQLVDSRIPKVLLSGSLEHQLEHRFDVRIEKPYSAEDIRNLIQSFADLASVI